MKKMIKMMVAVAVFAMAVLVTPESTGASAPKKVRIGDCDDIAGEYIGTGTQDFTVPTVEGGPTFTVRCEYSLRLTISPDCTGTMEISGTPDCYFLP